MAKSTKKATPKPRFEEMDQYDFGDQDSVMDKRHNHYAAYIGSFLIYFSELEHDLDRAVADLIFDRAHEKGYIIIKEMRMYSKIELYKDLLSPIIKGTKGREVQLKVALKKLLERLKAINTLRNRIAHAKWNTLDKDGYVRTKVESENGITRYKSELLTPRIISKGITEIIKLQELVYEIPQRSWNNFNSMYRRRERASKKRKKPVS